MYINARLGILTLYFVACLLAGLALWPTVRGSADLGAARGFVLAAHFWGVVASTWVTLAIYQIAHYSGWNKRIRSGFWQQVLFLPWLILTLVAAGWSVFSINASLTTHLWALTLFFVVFMVWDMLMMRTDKTEDDLVARACESKARYWLWYVDLPTPVLFWAAYLISSSALRGLKFEDHLPAHELVMSGVVATVLIGSVWDWFLDCAKSWET